MPNTTSKSNKSRKRKRERSESPRSFISPSPAFSIASNRSINEDLKQIWENPNNQPLDTSRKTMSDEVKNFLPDNVQRIYREFRKKNGGKKSLTIKKKKARKTLKKPMFKRKSAKHK